VSQQLFDAIAAGDVDGVARIVADDPTAASAREGSGLPAVLAAQYRHRQDMVDVLLAAGPELDVFAAAAVGDVPRLEALLSGDPSLVDGFAADGFFPLGLAAYFGRPEAVQVLLERGADVGASARNPMGVQALHAAVAGRDLRSVTLLVDAGADANARQHDGWTPLMAAAAHGDGDVVDALLAAGADASPANDDGADAASLAEQNGHPDLARRLRAAVTR
jgi:ankyrin repeat protein